MADRTIEEESTTMHDINLIYSQYMVDKILEERREEATNARRVRASTTPVPLMARVMALLRWSRTTAAAAPPVAGVAPKTEVA